MSIPQVRSGGAGSARDLGPSPVINRPDTGAGLQRAGRQIGQFAQQLQEQRVQADQLKAQEAEAKFDRRVQEEINKIDPTAANYDQKVEEAITTARQEARQDLDLETNQVQEQLETTLDVTAEQQRAFAFERRQQGLNQRAQRRLEEQTQQTAAKVRRNPEGFGDFVSEFQAKASEINANLSDEQADRLSKEANRQFVEARAVGLAEQGRPGEARRVIEGNGGVFSTGQARALKQQVRGIENQQEQEQLANTQGTRNEIELGITRAQSIGELNQLQSRIDQADEQGAFTGAQGQKTNLQERIIRKKRQIAEEQREQTRSLQNVENGQIGSQSEADDAWEAFSRSQNLAQVSPQERVDAVSSFVDKTGWVPSSVKNPIENADRGAGGVNDLAEAAATYSTIRKSNPHADTGAFEDGSRVRLTAKLHDNLGISFDQAADRVANNVPDRAALKDRRQEFNDDIAPSLNGDALVRESVRGAESSLFGAVGEDADVPQDMRQRAREIFQTHFEVTGDKELARSATQEALQERFTVTRVNGQSTITRAAPERHVPGGTANQLRRAGEGETITRAVRQDVTNQLQQAGISIPDPPPGQQDMPAFRLAATDERRIARGQTPRWQVQVRTSLGNFTPVTVRAQDGSERTLTYDMMSPEEFRQTQAVRDLRQRRLDEARETREDIEEGTRPGGRGSGRFATTPSGASVDDGVPEPAPRDEDPGGATRLGPGDAPGQ